MRVPATAMSPPRVVTTVLRHIDEAVFSARGRVEAELVGLADDAADIILPGVGGVPVVVSPVHQGGGVGHQGGPGGHMHLATWVNILPRRLINKKNAIKMNFVKKKT